MNPTAAEKLSAFRKSRKGWAAVRDRLIYKDQEEYLDGPEVPAQTRLDLIRQVDRVSKLTGFSAYLLTYLDSLIQPGKKNRTSPLKILDVGFGGGGMLEEIYLHLTAKRIPIDLHGVELSGDLVDSVRDRLDRVGVPATLIRQDARDLSFDDGSFDVVFSSYTVHHLRQTDHVTEFFGELRRVGRSGFVVDVDRRFWAPLYCSMIGLFGVPWPVVSDGIRSARRAYSTEEINFLINASGLSESFDAPSCVGRPVLPHWVVKWSAEK
jgi:SAM-dependent methyltransferase